MKLFPGNSQIQKVQFDLDTFENQRLSNVIAFWRFYNGQHWQWARENGEPTQTINYAKAFVDIGVDFLMGNSFGITSRRDENLEELVPTLNDVWDDNDRELLAQELALTGGVTGDAWIEVTWDPMLSRVVLGVLDSAMVFPLWNPHDRNEMLQCTIMYTAWEKEGNAAEGDDLWVRPTAGNSNDGVRPYTYRKVYTPETVREYHDDALVSSIPNPIGMIPIAHAKNMPTTSNYGESDLKDIVGLNREYNEKLTTISDIIDYSGTPTTIIYGARAEQLQKNANKIWSGIPKEARIENLNLDTDLPAANNFLEAMKMAMHEVASVPQHAFGEIQPISNTSGVALQVMYHPIVRKTKKKRLTYAKGIKEANILILKYLEVFGGLVLSKYQHPYDSTVTYPDMLPKDEMLSMQVQLEKLSAGLTSRAQILREEYSMPEEKITKLLAESDADKQKQLEAQMAAQYNVDPGMMGSNVETDSLAGNMASETRQQDTSDGRGRPATKKE